MLYLHYSHIYIELNFSFWMQLWLFHLPKIKENEINVSQLATMG